MIEIRITDPHLMDAVVLLRTAEYLTGLAQKQDYPVLKDPYGPVETSEPEPEAPPVAAPCPPSMPPAPLPPCTTLPPSPIPAVSPTFPAAKGTGGVIIDIPPTEINTEVDARGMPWDARIHSRTKSKTAAGNWKAQRGIAPSLVKQIETESGINPTEPVKKPEDVFKQAQAIEEAENPFPKFMSDVTALANTGKIGFRRVIELVQSCGVPNIASVSARPDLIPEIMAKIQDDMAGAA
jgi:hypothetical protein